MAERILFLTGHLAARATGKGPRRDRRSRFRMVGDRRRRQGRRAHDRGDHCAPAAAPGRCQPGHGARSLPGGSRTPYGRIRRAVRARPRRIKRPAGLFRQARPRRRSIAARYAHLRRDRRRVRARRRHDLARAASMRAAGADVIDLGCLPDTPFPHLEDAVRALRASGYDVSVDSARYGGTAPRRQGGRAVPAEPDRSNHSISPAKPARFPF